MSTILVIIGMAVVTYAVRYPPLAAVGRVTLPNSVAKALEFVPVAVLSAIIIPAIIFPSGSEGGVSLQNSYLVAGIIASIIAWRTKNLLWTIILGMLVFSIWKFLVVPQFLA